VISPEVFFFFFFFFLQLVYLNFPQTTASYKLHMQVGCRPTLHGLLLPHTVLVPRNTGGVPGGCLRPLHGLLLLGHNVCAPHCGPAVVQKVVVGDVKESVCRVPESAFDGWALNCGVPMHCFCPARVHALYAHRLFHTGCFMQAVAPSVRNAAMALSSEAVSPPMWRALSPSAEASFANVPTVPYELPDGQ